MSEPTKRFVEADEICKELKICKRTLARWIEAGRFPPPLRLHLRRQVWLRVSYENHIQEASKDKKDMVR